MLPLITLDGLSKFKDSSLHEALIGIIDSLYVPKSPIQYSKWYMDILIANIMLISGSIAAFIEHSETSIS